MRSASVRAQLSAAYFLYFVTFGLYLPYFPAYLRARGLDGVRIGWVLALGPVSRDFAPLFLGVALYCAATAATIPLLDSASLQYLQRAGGRYGHIRLWGSVGFILTSTGLGLCYANLPAAVIMASLAVAHLLFAAFITFARIDDAPLDGGLFSRGALLRALFRDRRVWLLITTLALNRVASAPFNAFYTVFVQDHGLGGDVVALTWGIAITTEVFVMLAVDRVIDRLGTRAVLALGISLEAARWFAYAALHTKTALLLIAPGHGLAFAMIYVAGVRAMAEIAPRELRSLAQGLGTAAAASGQVIGFIAAGYLNRFAGDTVMFLAGGAVGLVALLNALILGTGRGRAEDGTTPLSPA